MIVNMAVRGGIVFFFFFFFFYFMVFCLWGGGGGWGVIFFFFFFRSIFFFAVVGPKKKNCKYFSFDIFINILGFFRAQMSIYLPIKKLLIYWFNQSTQTLKKTFFLELYLFLGCSKIMGLKHCPTLFRQALGRQDFFS